MKGVILAGGAGSRLFPLTKITNKHLLPIFNLPMIFYPLQTLVNAGIQDIMIVTGGRNAGDFLRLLNNGKEFGLKHIQYAYQEGEGGIADALRLTEHFVGDDKSCVILGDNLIENNVLHAVQTFESQPRGAHIILKDVANPERFGVPVFKNDRIDSIIEKPANPPSNFAVIGIYLYDSSVFARIRQLKPSGRGELEITDVNNSYLRDGQLTHSILDGWWTDAGTFESLHAAANLVASTGANKINGQAVALCLHQGGDAANLNG